MQEAQALQATIDRIVQGRDVELLVEPHDQIAGPPAHDAIERRDRAVFHKASEECFMFVCQLARRARRHLVDETVRPLLVEPDHPIPRVCRSMPSNPCGAVEHGRNYQRLTRLRCILYPLRDSPTSQLL